MSAQGRARIVPPVFRRGGCAAIAILTSFQLILCAGHQAPLETFQFEEGDYLEIAEIIDRNTISLADGLSDDLVNDLDALTPVSVSVRPDFLIVSDLRSGRIIKMEDDNIEVQAGTGPVSMLLGSRRPARFVRTDVGGNVYASDGVNDRIAIYDARLRAVSELAPPYLALEYPDGQLTGIAAGAYGELYIADQVNAVIYRFDASGAFISTITGEGALWAQMQRPMGLACDNHTGSIFVCDPGARHVVVFDNSGAPLRSFGDSDLREPVAVAVDDHGQAYVADPTLQAVFVYTREGHLIGRIDSDQFEVDDFGTPSDVAIDGEDLLIVDPTHGRILRIRHVDESEVVPAG